MPAGNVADLSFGIQTAKGTAAATPSVRAYLAGGGINPERTTADVEESAAGRLRSDTYVQMSRAGGTPAFWVRPQMIVPLLQGAMGTRVSGAGPDPFVHTMTLALTQPYMTFWKMVQALLFERFHDCKISSLNFSSEAGGLLRVEVGVVGLNPSAQVAHNTTATPEAVTPFTHMNGKGQFKAENAVVSQIRAARVNIATGADTWQGDGVTPDEVNEGMFDITMETEQNIVNYDLWRRWHYGSTSPAADAPPTPNVLEFTGADAISFKWSKRQADGTPATPERSIEFEATRVQVTNITPAEPNSSGEPLTRTVTYRVVQPSGATSGLTAIVNNGLAGTAYAPS